MLPAAPTAVVPHNFAFHTCPSTHDCAHGEFDASFEFLHPVKGSSDNFISGGFVFGATQASGGFLVLEFPTVSHLWDHDSFWVTLSEQRPDGWRRGLWMEQLSMLSACPGFYHNATISLRCSPTCTLRVAVDGNPMQPLLDGMPLRQGGTLSLSASSSHPDTPRPGFLGLVSSNGHAPAVKVNFRNLSVSSHGTLPAPAAGGPTWSGLSPPGSPWTMANTSEWPLESFPGGNWVADPRRNGHIVVFSNGMLMRSKDGGRTFPDTASGVQAPSIPAILGSRCAGWIGDDGSLACYVLSPSGTGAIHPGYLYKATATSFGADWTPTRAVYNVSFPADWMPTGIPTNLSSCVCCTSLKHFRWVWITRGCLVRPGCRSSKASSA